MSAPLELRQSRAAASHVLQGKVESALQRSVFHKWREFVKDRQFEVHLKRCATSMKHSTRRRMYSTYFLRWLAVSQRSASAEAKASYSIPQEVPLTTKKSILTFTRRYFHKWKRHNRELRQRTVANVKAILAMNDERARYRALFLWQTHALRKRMAAPATSVERQESDTHLVEAALRAVDVLGGRSGAASALQSSPDETQQATAVRVDRTADALSGLCDDLVVVLVLANEWSKEGHSGKVSELLERLWREKEQLKEAGEDKDATLAELRQVMEEAAATLDGSSLSTTGGRSGDPVAARQRRQHAEMAAKYASDSGDGVPAQLLGATDAVAAVLRAKDAEIAQKTAAIEALQRAVVYALEEIGDEEAVQPLHTPSKDGATCDAAALSQALEKLIDKISRAPTIVSEPHDGGGLPRLLDDIHKRADKSNRDNEALATQLKDAQVQLAKLQGELDNTHKTVQQQQDDTQHQVTALQARERELCENLDQLSGEVDQLEIQLQEQKAATSQAESTLAAAQEEVARLTDTVQRQESAIGDLERTNQNAAKRLDQLANQFEDKSREYRDNEAGKAAEVKQLNEQLADAKAGTQKAEEALRAAQEEAARLKDTVQQQESTIADLERTNQNAAKRLDQLANQFEDKSREYRDNEAGKAAEVKQLNEQLADAKAGTQKAEEALRAAQEEAARLKDTVQQQESTIADLERTNQNAAKRLDQLANQFEDKSREYREKDAERAVEVQELQSAVQRALVSLHGQEESDSLLDTALSSNSGTLDNTARSKALVDALDVACHSLDGVQNGESVSDFAFRAGAEKSALEQQLQAAKDRFNTLEHIVTVANDMLLNPRLSDISIEAAGAVVSAETLAASGAPGAKTLMTNVPGIADEACSCLETLPKKRDDPASHTDTLNNTAGESVKDVLKMCGDALYDMSGVVSGSMETAASNEALSVFLRDVVRDAIGRVASLANNLCATLGGETSPSAWQSLQLSEAPLPLSMDRDPSEYVEYILRHVDLNDEGKRLVQDHLRAEATLEPKLNKNAAVEQAMASERQALGGTLDPSTAHEKRAEGDSASAPPPAPTPPAQSFSPPPCTWDVVAEFHDLLAMLTDLSVQSDEKFGQQAKRISAMDNAMRRIIEDLGLSEDATPEDVSQAVESAVRACQTWRTFTDDSVEAMGGLNEDDPEDTTAKHIATDPAAAEQLAGKLLNLCSQTSDALHQLQADLGLPNSATAATASGLSQDLQGIHKHIQQLQSLRDESDAFIQGLNRAFDDETMSSAASSTLSSRGRTLRSKRKPLPAAAVREGEVFMLKQAKKPVTKSVEAMTPEEKLRALRTLARDKLEEVQELRRACRAALWILEGTYSPTKKVPAYGEALVPRLLQQLEDLKRALPLTDSFVETDLAASGTGLGEDRSVAVGTRLSTLAGMVQSLQLTQAGLQDSLAAKALQSAVVLEDVQHESTQLRAQYQQAYEQLQAARERERGMQQQLNAVQEALNAQTDAAAQAQTQVSDATSTLHEAETAKTVMEAQLEAERGENEVLTKHATVLQHDTNVLTNALGAVLASLTQAAHTSPDQTECAEIERVIQRHLKAGDEDGVAALVQKAVAQNQQWLNRLGTDYKDQLAVLRRDLEGLRSYVLHGFRQELAPLCATVLSESEAAVQLLSIENDMLRPRALERETLANEKKALLDVVNKKEAELTATRAALELSDDQNAHLRRTLCEAEMARILDGTDSDKNSSSGDDGATAPTTGAAARYRGGATLRSKEYAALLSDLEGKMIRGATALTVEAMDAMSGKDMAKAFGAVAEDTCELYDTVHRRLQAVLDAFSLYPPTNAFNQRCLEEAVAEEKQGLDECAGRAKRLWDCLPPFFAAPYATAAARTKTTVVAAPAT